MQLALIPLFPLIAFAVLALFGTRLSKQQAMILGVGGVGASFIASAILITIFGLGTGGAEAWREILWTWIPFYSSEFDTATVQMGLYLDWLSVVMLLVVTFISSLIALFATSFMEEDQELPWFFACMNLFVSFMLVLVLADNLLVLFLGWEGVGLCSYLLIGFWRDDVKNGLAAMKAFVTTRIGDVFLLFAMFILFAAFGTLNIAEILDLADANWQVGSLIATTTALCLLMGAAGKSAQIPLQVWLADAMKGPTPVSALIHAATMVTAGVYLIARLGGLFALSPIAQTVVLVVGALTLLVAGIAALLQNDIKRVLAYSTMSQIGYMFLALGAGAYSAAVFHLATHACFKALLFLGAGAIGHLMHHEYSLLKVGGLGFKNPWLWGVFAVGLGSLTALPFVTSGFYSKEMILSQVLGSAGMWPWALGVLGAVLTGIYSARLFTLLFITPLPQGEGDFGLPKSGAGIDWRMKLPLGILMVLSVIAGFFPISAMVDRSVMPSIELVSTTHWPEIVAVCAGLMGLGIGARFVYAVPSADSFWSLNLGFDGLYTALILRPYEKLSFLMKADPIRAVYRLMVMLAGALQNLLLRLQTGNTLNYVAAMIVSVALFLAWVVYS